MRVKRGLRPAIPVVNVLPNTKKDEDLLAMNNEPTDPYFPLQWYLRNTGQNGGKIRLDLNVQAAWDQGITGKNVTTAIMDDGKCCYVITMKIIISSLPLFTNVTITLILNYGNLNKLNNKCYSACCP